MSAIIEPLIELYQRELDTLLKEVKSYKKEENLWLTGGDIANSGGNLALQPLRQSQTFYWGHFGW